MEMAQDDCLEIDWWSEDCIPIDDDEFFDDSNFCGSAALPLNCKPHEQKIEDDAKENQGKEQNKTEKKTNTPVPEMSNKCEKNDNKKKPPVQRKKDNHGFSSKKPHFPSFSIINAKEQASFLQLARKFTPDRLPYLDRREQGELRVFMTLFRKVQAEQRDYISFVRKQSKLNPINYEIMNPMCRTYIEAVLKTRQNNIPLKYHSLYHYASTIGLSRVSTDLQGQAVELVPDKELLNLGTVACLQHPKLGMKTVLPKSLETLELHYPSSGLISPDYINEILPGEKVLYNTPVSEDNNAARLAVAHDANIVISSSVMQALVDCHANHPQNCAPPRDIPVVIKIIQDANGNQKKVIFLDKLLPPVGMSLYDKKSWYSRKATKILFCRRDKRIYNFSLGQEVPVDNAKKSTETMQIKTPKPEVVSFEEELKALHNLLQKKNELEQVAKSKEKLELSIDKNKADEKDAPPMKRLKMLSEIEERNKKHLLEETAPPKSCEVDEDKNDVSTEEGEFNDVKESGICNIGLPIFPAPNRNVVYGTWYIRKKTPNRLAAAGSSWERGSAEIKLLVRSNYHAYEIEPNTGTIRMVHTSVKLEHQPEYGAQTSTVGEVAREWMALFLRPNSVLHRVHVNAVTMEVIQSQRLTIRDIFNEGRRRELNCTQKLESLHHVFSQLMKLGPGNYLLKLKPLDGWAELLCQDTSGSRLRGGPMFHLHLAYNRAEAHEGPKSRVPYSPINTDLATPYHCHYHRIPGTYQPAPPHGKKRKNKNRQAKRREKLALKKHTNKVVAELNEQEALEDETSKESGPNASSEMKEDENIENTSGFITEVDDWFNPASPYDSQEGALMIVDEEESDEDQMDVI